MMPTPESISASSSFADPPQKRRRAHLACISCRDRKSRCDGSRPACSSCVRRKQADSCVYDQAAVASNRHISALEDRIRNLERRHSRASEPDTDITSGNNPISVPEPVGIAAGSTFLHTTNAEDVRTSKQTTTPSNSHGPPSTTSRSEATFQVDALGTVMPSESNDDFTYGGSSTIAFLRQAGKAGRGANNATTAPQGILASSRGPTQLADEPDPITITQPRRLPLHEDGLSALPIRYRADRYLNCYWEFVHPLFPVFYKPHFMARYEKLWLPRPDEGVDSTDEALFLCNLNLALALGCQFCGEGQPGELLRMSNQFFERSQHFMTYDFLGSTSLSVIQWLLLTAIYCQSTSHASRCWNSVGLAIRMAQNMGLHLEHPSAAALNQMETEIRRRIWHTCVVLDRLLAMTFGRQVMIDRDSYSTDIPLEIDDEYLQEGEAGSQPPDRPSKLGLFVASCRLFEILNGILSSSYGPNSDPKHYNNAWLQQALGDVLKYNRQLDQFLESVPDYLNTWLCPRALILGEEPYIHLQQQVLCCRFLYMKILCLRPMLLVAIQNQGEDTFQCTTIDKNLIKWCSSACAETAYRLVDTIDKNLETLYKSPGWHSVYFVFASATIILFSQNLGNSSSDSEMTFENSWTSCFRVLNHYRDSVPAAPRAIMVLENLRRQIQTYNGQSSSSIPHMDSAGQAERGSMPVPIDQMFGSSEHLEIGEMNDDFTTALCDAWFTQQFFGVDSVENT